MNALMSAPKPSTRTETACDRAEHADQNLLAACCSLASHESLRLGRSLPGRRPPAWCVACDLCRMHLQEATLTPALEEQRRILAKHGDTIDMDVLSEMEVRTLPGLHACLMAASDHSCCPAIGTCR